MLNEVMIANKNYATVVVKDGAGLDKIATNVIKYDCPPFLLSMHLISIDNDMQLRFEIAGGIRLAYMPMQMKKIELNRLLNQLLAPYVECADWFLDFHNIYLDRNYIMVEQNGFKVKYIYMPYKHVTQTDEQIMRFFCDLIMEVELQDDPAYIATLMRCIMGRDASINTLANIVKDNLKREEMPAGNSVPVEMSGQRMTTPVQAVAIQETSALQEKSDEVKQAEPAKEFGENDLASSIGAGLFGEDDKKADKKTNKKADKKTDKKAKPPKENKNFFGKILGNDKKAKKDIIASPIVNEMKQNNAVAAPVNEYREQMSAQRKNNAEENFNTEIFEEEEEITGKLRLSLQGSLVSNVPNTIDLDMAKGYAVIGRYDKTGKLSADFNFDMSLTFIGRRHARFEMSGDEVYIIDLESKNHTYLNNEELLPNRRYLLHKGDRITFAQKYGIIYQVC